MADIDLVTKSYQSRERAFSVTLLPGQSLLDIAPTDADVAAFIALAKATVPASLPPEKVIRAIGLLRMEVVDAEA